MDYFSHLEFSMASKLWPQLHLGKMKFSLLANGAKDLQRDPNFSFCLRYNFSTKTLYLKEAH